MALFYECNLESKHPLAIVHVKLDCPIQGPSRLLLFYRADAFSHRLLGLRPVPLDRISNKNASVDFTAYDTRLIGPP